MERSLTTWDFSNFLESPKFADFIIKVQREHPSHRILLVSKSNYFKALLERWTQNEVTLGEDPTMPGWMTDELLDGFLTWLYTGDVPDSDNYTIADWIHLASYFDVKEMNDYLIMKFPQTPGGVGDILLFWHRYPRQGEVIIEKIPNFDRVITEAINRANLAYLSNPGSLQNLPVPGESVLSALIDYYREKIGTISPELKQLIINSVNAGIYEYAEGEEEAINRLSAPPEFGSQYPYLYQGGRPGIIWQ